MLSSADSTYFYIVTMFYERVTNFIVCDYRSEKI